MKQKIAIIGAGNWGTTLAILLARKGIRVELYSVFAKHNAQMQRSRENKTFLKGTKFPRTLTVNPSLKDVLVNEVIIIAIPVQFVRGVLRKIKREKISLKDKVLVSVSKGIERTSLKRVSQIVRKELPRVRIVVLSGPNIAKEVLVGVPTTSIIACGDKRVASKLQKLFATPTFRIYLHQDVVGVELGGALKNIIAIACGISDGLGFGTNTKAALVTRGLVEITRLGVRLGATASTFWGIAGLGDLVTTCFSPHSRNRFVGEEIGRGRHLPAIVKKMSMVAEGVETVYSAYRLGKKLKVEMPITKEVYNVLYRRKSPSKAVRDLMERPLKREIIG